MIETHKETLEERKRKRREYLKKKTWLSIIRFVSVGILLLGGLLALLEVFLIAMIGSRAVFSLAPMALFLSSGVILLGYRFFRSVNKMTKLITYVPPVSEQVANLPAEEILVRGSEQPAVSPDELLRAIQAGEGDPAEELLRAVHRHETQ